MNIHPKLIFALGIFAAILLVSLGLFMLPLKPSLVALQLTFTQKSFSDIYNTWSGSDKSRFQAHFAADYVFILVYSIWGYLHANRSVSMQWFNSTARHALSLALPFAGGMDIVEDLLHQFITSGPTLSVNSVLYLLAGCAASLKWTAGIGFLGAAAIAKWTHQGAA